MKKTISSVQLVQKAFKLKIFEASVETLSENKLEIKKITFKSSEIESNVECLINIFLMIKEHKVIGVCSSQSTINNLMHGPYILSSEILNHLINHEEKII